MSLKIKPEKGDMLYAEVGSELTHLLNGHGSKVRIQIIDVMGRRFDVRVLDEIPSLLNFNWGTNGNDEWFKFLSDSIETPDPSCL